MKVIEIDYPQEFGALQGATLKYGNFTAMTLSFDADCPEIDSPAPFVYREEITLKLGGKIVLIGIVTKCKQALTGNKYKWDVEISDRWWFLQESQYLVPAPKKDTFSVFYASGANINTGGVIVNISTKEALAKILSYSVEAKHISAYELRVDPYAIFNFTTEGTPAEILLKIKTQNPNLVSWFDYSVSPPKLVIADQSRCDVATLDIQLDGLTEITLNARPDLVPTAVAVLNCRDGGVVSSRIYPPNADIKQPGCVVTRIQNPAQDSEKPEEKPKEDGLKGDIWNFTRQRMTVRGKKLPTGSRDAAEWWQSKQPLLKKVPGCVYGKITKTVTGTAPLDDPSYSPDATQYELSEGTVSTRCKSIKWSNITLSQYISIPTRPPKEYKFLFPNALDHGRFGGILHWQGRTTNVMRRSYDVAPAGTESPEKEDSPPEPEPPPEPDKPPIEPDYSQVIKDYYDSNQKLQWDGSVNIINPIQFERVVGHTLSILRGRKEWETMTTTIQTISYDLYSKKLDITTGPAEHLSLDDLLERSRQIKELNDKTSENQDKPDAPNSKPPVDNSWQFDKARKKQPIAPTVGPSGGIIPSGVPDQVEAGFYCKRICDEDGNVTGVEVKQGQVVGPRNTKNAGDEEWTKFNIGDVYCNVSVDIWGYITTVSFDQAPMIAKEPHPIYWAKRGKSGEAKDERAMDFSGEEGSYAIKVANVTADCVTQYAFGTIYLPVMPMSVLHEIYDDDPTLPAGSPGGSPSSPSPGTNSAVSLISKRERRYTQLKKIKGEGEVSVRIEGDAVIVSVGTVTQSSLPSRQSSVPQHNITDMP